MANKKLKKSELLFNEGDPSKSMYFIQRGSIRLFKKKGTSQIELGVLHTGEVIGEMGFLDGGPRSASAEAMSETDLVEITGDKMQEVAKAIPSWLLVLLKTVVNRLRSANTKIKQLETVSTSITYGRDGPTKEYAFLTVYDVMKICSALLLVAGRSTEKDSEGNAKVKLGAFQRYCNSIFGVPQSKSTELFDVLNRVGLLKIDKVKDAKGAERTDIYAKDLAFLDQFVTFVCEENQKDQQKKLTFSPRGVHVMGLVVKYLPEFPAEADGFSSVNLASIIEREKAANGGKEPFLSEEFNEMVRNKVATELSIKDSKTMITRIPPGTVIALYKMLSIMREIEMVNDSKRRAA